MNLLFWYLCASKGYIFRYYFDAVVSMGHQKRPDSRTVQSNGMTNLVYGIRLKQTLYSRCGTILIQNAVKWKARSPQMHAEYSFTYFTEGQKNEW